MTKLESILRLAEIALGDSGDSVRFVVYASAEGKYSLRWRRNGALETATLGALTEREVILIFIGVVYGAEESRRRSSSP